MGVEITNKTLGIIGCGNIGAIVANRAIGLKMKVIAYDPFLSPERAHDLGVEKVELEELMRRADFITLHTPLTEQNQKHHRCQGARSHEEGRAGHQLCAAGGLSTSRLCVRRSTAATLPVPHSTSSCEEPADEQSVVWASQCRVHAASRRFHRGGSGKRRAADRRADGGLSAARGHIERGELSFNYCGRGAAAAAVHRPCGKARLLRGATHRKRDQEGECFLRRSSCRHEHQGADLGRGRGAFAPHAAGRERRLRADPRQGTRHHHRGDDARGWPPITRISSLWRS